MPGKSGSLRVAIVAGALVVVIAAVAVFLLGGDEAAPPDVAPPRAPEVHAASDAGAAPLDAARFASQQRDVAAAGADEEPDAAAPPPSFTAALGGVTGRLVETDGTPVAGLKVELLGGMIEDFFTDLTVAFAAAPPDFAAVKSSDVSGDDGRFTLGNAQREGFHLLGIDLGGVRPSVRMLDMGIRSGGVVDLGDVVLAPFVTFSGRVVDDDGEPIAGAHVRGVTGIPPIVFQFGVADLQGDSAMCGQEDGRWMVVRAPPWLAALIDRLPIPQTWTAEDGTFAIAGIQPGAAHVVVRAEGLVTLVHGPVVTGVSGGTRDVGTLRMDFGDEIRGAVRTTSGDPVAGAEVLLGPAIAGEEAALLRPAGRTQADGTFRAEGLGDGSFTVAVRRDGDVDWTVAQGAMPGGDPVQIVIPVAHSLTIRALDPQGQVVQHPEVAVAGFGGAMFFTLNPPRVVTDRVERLEDGSLRLRELGSDRYEVLVRAPGFAVSAVTVDLAEGDRTETVALEPARDLIVRVTAAGSGDAVAAAHVSARTGGGMQQTISPIAAGRTGADGRVRLAGLQHGKVHLRVAHPGFATTLVEADAGQDAEVDVVLSNGGSVAGRVHEAGQPIGEPRFLLMNGEEDELAMPRFTVTGLDGAYAVEGLLPGAYEMIVMRRFADELRLETLPAKATSMFGMMMMPEQQVEFVIEEGRETRLDVDVLGAAVEGPQALLRGTVRVNGRPANRCAVQAQPVNAWRAQRSTYTGEDGTFDLGSLPAGDVRLTASPEGLESAQPWRGGFYVRVLRLAPNEVRTLDVDVRTGSVEGRIVADADGRAVANAEVVLASEGMEEAFTYRIGGDGEGAAEAQPPERGSSSQSTTADAEGRFRFELVPADDYRCKVEAEGFIDADHGPVAVHYGAPARVEVRMTKGAAIDGRMELPAVGDDVNLWLSLESADESAPRAPEFVDFDDESGAFHVPSVAPGRYRFVLRGWRTAETDASARMIDFEPIPVEVPPEGLAGLVLHPVVAE